MLDETEPAEILQDILNGTDLIRVDIFPEDELCDGTRQPVRIGFGEDFCTVEAVMPFRAETPVAETNVPEKAVEEAEEVEQTTVVLTEEDTGFPVPILLVAAFGIFLIAVIAAAVILVKKGKQKEPEQKDVDLSEIGHSRETPAEFSEIRRWDRNPESGADRRACQNGYHQWRQNGKAVPAGHS